MAPDDDGPLAGHLLVAAPSLLDPNFHRTVVLVLDHTDDGALGLVLNRPSRTAVGELLEPWAAVAAAPGLVHVGGPVEPTAVIALGGVPPGVATDGWEPIVDGLRVVDLGADVALAATELTAIRVFAGYAGWGPGQLEAEVGEDAWLTAPAMATDALTADPDGLWPVAMERAGVDPRLLATMPEDPSMN